MREGGREGGRNGVKEGERLLIIIRMKILIIKK